MDGLGHVFIISLSKAALEIMDFVAKVGCVLAVGKEGSISRREGIMADAIMTGRSLKDVFEKRIAHSSLRNVAIGSSCAPCHVFKGEAL